ncbi:MAG: hypothetical protein Q7V01_02050 [Vicinamibacterales bacterium]|nr:hypothetical protein [Vicinamibacterales bacterium]
MAFHYRPEILDQLLQHGLRPGPDTRPAVVFGYLNDLYRYELRALRDQLRQRRFRQSEYVGRVVALRRKYPLVSVHPSAWTIPGTPSEPADLPLC